MLALSQHEVGEEGETGPGQPAQMISVVMMIMMMIVMVIMMMMMVTQHIPTSHIPTRWESVIVMVMVMVKVFVSTPRRFTAHKVPNKQQHFLFWSLSHNPQSVSNFSTFQQGQ